MSDARVVLVGAGHAHLHLATAARELQRHGAQVTLVDPGAFWYSGAAPAMLGGAIDARRARLDPAGLIEAAGGRFVAARAVALDRQHRQLTLDDGRRLDYDWLSFNVGSGVADAALPAGGPPVITAKPIPRLWRLRRRLDARWRRGESPHIAVLGGGATGCEIAANLRALARRRGRQLTVRLIQRGPRLTPTLPAGAARRLTRALRQRGVAVHTGCTITQAEPQAITLSDGTTHRADALVAATGLRAPAWLAQTDLDFDDGLRVDRYLRCTGTARIFAVGDCARLSDPARPRLGVFGVRQAPVLQANLNNLLRGNDRLRPFVPQNRWLQILDLGDGHALAVRGQLWWYGRTSLWLKRWLDRRFLTAYRVRGG